MNRRIFLKNSISASMAPVFLTGFGNQMLNASVLPAGFGSNSIACEDRCMVILYMAGGNDIINTILAESQLDNNSQNVDNKSNYEVARPNTAHHLVGTAKYLNNGTLQNNNDGLNLRLHNSLDGIQSLFGQDKFKLIQRVGYDQVNGSHFSAESILLRGIDGTSTNSAEKEGWIARFLKDRYPQYAGVPIEGQLDPMGIVFSNPVKLGFHTEEEHNYHISLTNQDAGELFNTVNSISGNSVVEPGDNCIHEMLQYASLIEKTTQVYSNRIQCVFEHGSNSTSVNYPTKPDNNSELTDLALQLKTVARLIHGGSKTKIFMVQVGGFDTHVNQLDKHAELLTDVGNSLAAFQEELTDLNVSHKALTVAFSEFGRKVIDNGGGGTDHGTLSSMFVLGDAVPSGVLGSDFNLDTSEGSTAINAQGAPNPLSVAEGGQMDYDYRSVYAQILKQWFGADDCSLINTFVPGLQKDCREEFPSSIPSFLQPVLGQNPTFPSIACNDCQNMDCTLFTPISDHTVSLRLKVFLEGFMLDGNTQMNTNLAQQPNGGERLLPDSQPYNSTRYKYFGEETTENVNSLTDMVDWLYIEIYQSNGLKLDLCPEPLVDPDDSQPFSKPIAKRAVLVNSNGWLIDSGTNSDTLNFDLYEGTYRIAVYHRSHLGVLVEQEITAPSNSGTPLILDLTDNGNAKVIGRDQLKSIGGIYAMRAGDVDQNGVINNIDHNLIKRNNNATGYKATDLDGDGATNNTDLDLRKGNKSRIGEPLAHKLIK